MSFITALVVYAQILRSNPVSGKNAAADDDIEWAQRVKRPRGDYGTRTEAFMDAFGPVQVPTLVPNLPIYQEHKAACADVLGY